MTKHATHKTQVSHTGHAHKKDSGAHEHKHAVHSKHTPAHAVHKKPRKAWHKKEHKQPIFMAFLVVLALVILYGLIGGKSTSQIGDYPAFGDKYGTVTMEMYVMSQCPYGTQVEDAIQPVLEQLGDSVDFNLEFIGEIYTETEYTQMNPQRQAQCHEKADGKYYCSLHSKPEVDGDIIQLCAREYTSELFVMDFVVCMNKNARAIPGNWGGCATELEMPVEKMRMCYEGEEGRALYAESVKKADEANARASPTLFVNSQPYQGGRDSISFQKALCAQLDNHPACESMPACAVDFDCIANPDKIGKCENPNTANAKCVYEDAVAVDVIVLNDKNCKTCDITELNEITKQLFKGAVFRNVDVSSSEGQTLIAEFSVTRVPAFIFDSNLDDTYMWGINPSIQGAFITVGDRYRLRDDATGASHFVDEEAREAHYELIGITIGDNRPQIDFFVMSYCPYGNQAEELLKPVFDVLGSKADFNPRYVIYSNYKSGYPQYCIDEESKYCSMHGIVELNQDIREMCVNKYMGTANWFDFAIAMNQDCNVQNADTCWEGVADKLELDKKKITDCFKNEAIELLAKDKTLGDTLGVSGSPAVFFEGETYAGQRSSTGYNAALCNAFDEQPSECDSLVSDDSATVTGSAVGGGSC